MAATTTVIPARSGAWFPISKGRTVDIINTFGQQVVDFWAFRRDDPAECLSMEHTRSCLEKIRFTRGDTLMTNRRRPLLEIVEDTSPGLHDSLLSACDEARYRLLGVTGYHASCAENFRTACLAANLRVAGLPAPWNVFMNVVVEDGRLRIEPPQSRAGDYVRLRAYADALVVLSACPMDIVPTNGAERVPRPVEYRLL